MAGTSPAIDPVSIGIQAAGMIAQTISNISDQNKRRLVEQTLALMSATEKQELENQIAKQNNKNAQITILLNTIMQARNAAADREQRKQVIKWVVVGVAGLSVIGLLIWYYKK